MTPADVKRYFSNGYLFKKKTGMSTQSFHNWMESGYVPIMSQLKLQEITKGELKANLDDIPRG